MSYFKRVAIFAEVSLRAVRRVAEQPVDAALQPLPLAAMRHGADGLVRHAAEEDHGEQLIEGDGGTQTATEYRNG